MEYLPRYEFQKCVGRYQGDARLRGFSCWDQYLAMGFAQLTYRESLRDIEACLGSVSGKLYHMGFRGKVARSNLADANEAHDWRIFADLAQTLIGIARPLYRDDPVAVDLDQTLYALDSTTLDLCLSLFPWAKFRRHKAAVKMHTLLDRRGNIPTFIGITEGKVSDVIMLDEILPEGGAFYVKARVAMEAIRAEKTLSQLRQCKLLGANRSGLYYQPLGESEENLQLMRLPDEQYTRAPFYGSRRMVEWLATKGFEVNRKRVRRLMEAMGIEAVYPKPKRARREKVTGSIRTC